MRGIVGDRPSNYAPHLSPITIVIQTVESQTPWFTRLCEICPDAWQYGHFKRRERFEQSRADMRGRHESPRKRLRDIARAFDRVMFEEQHGIAADDWDDHWSTLFTITYGYAY